MRYEYPPKDIEQRIINAREACLALYLDDPSPESAMLLVLLEHTAIARRKAVANG